MPSTDHYYRALFGCHVLKGAYIIGIFGVIFELFSLVYIFICSFFSNALWYHYIFNVISFLSYVLLMIAIKKERPQLIWFYLIGNTICLFLDVVLIIALLTYHSEITNNQHPEFKQKENEIAISTLLYAILVVISFLVNIYCMRVVWKAKTYLQHSHIQSSLYYLTGSQPYRASKWGEKETEMGLLSVN